MYNDSSRLDLMPVARGPERGTHNEENTVVDASGYLPLLASVRSNDADNHRNVDRYNERKLRSWLSQSSRYRSNFRPVGRELVGNDNDCLGRGRDSAIVRAHRFTFGIVADARSLYNSIRYFFASARLLHSGSPISFCREHYSRWGGNGQRTTRVSAAVRRSLCVSRSPDAIASRQAITPQAFLAAGF